MNCLKCGMINEVGATVCRNCNAPLTPDNTPVNNTPSVLTSVPSPSELPPKEVIAPPQNIQGCYETVIPESINYVKCLTGGFLKPFKNYNEEEKKLSNPKLSLILTAIIAGLLTIAGLVSAMITAARDIRFSLAGDIYYSWNIENIAELNFISLIFKNYVLYALMLFLIAGVFYVGSLFLKKRPNFFKLLGISSLSIIPFAIISMLISKIIGIFWTPLGTLCLFGGLIYTTILIYELINKELALEGEVKAYFYSISLCLILTLAFYIYLKLITSGLESIISNFL